MTSVFSDAHSKKTKNYRKILQERVMELERVLLHDADYRSYLFY